MAICSGQAAELYLPSHTFWPSHRPPSPLSSRPSSLLPLLSFLLSVVVVVVVVVGNRIVGDFGWWDGQGRQTAAVGPAMMAIGCVLLMAAVGVSVQDAAPGEGTASFVFRFSSNRIHDGLPADSKIFRSLQFRRSRDWIMSSGVPSFPLA